MTPERRKYLHSISEEELYVRFALSTVRNKLSIAKLNKSLGHLGETDAEIQDYKTIIIALKKQLSSPKRRGCCRVCGCVQPNGNISYYNYSYCPECGQKLR